MLVLSLLISICWLTGKDHTLQLALEWGMLADGKGYSVADVISFSKSSWKPDVRKITTDLGYLSAVHGNWRLLSRQMLRSVAGSPRALIHDLFISGGLRPIVLDHILLVVFLLSPFYDGRAVLRRRRRKRLARKHSICVSKCLFSFFFKANVVCLCHGLGWHPAAADRGRPPGRLWLLWTLQPRLWNPQPQGHPPSPGTWGRG